MSNLMLGNVLVTGCGGDIGIGIGRILRMENVATRIVGCDIHEDHPGREFFDEVETVPRANSPDYFEALKDLIMKYSINMIIPSSEDEIRAYFKNGIRDELANVPLVMANPEALDVSLDKLETAAFLEKLGRPFPWTKSITEGRPKNLPCIFKARSGSGSKTVAKVYEGLVDYYARYGEGYIWQEYLYPDNEEYTCGLFRATTGEVRVITFHRKLQGGLTGSGRVVSNSEIEELLHHLAESIKLVGSINVQLRLTERGPVIFEINPRFSSTLVFRHLLGYEDLIWCLQDRMNLCLSAYNPPSPGTRFYRASQEVIIRH